MQQQEDSEPCFFGPSLPFPPNPHVACFQQADSTAPLAPCPLGSSSWLHPSQYGLDHVVQPENCTYFCFVLVTLQVHRRKLHHKAPAVTHELLCRHCLGVVPAHRGWPSRVGTLGVSVNFWQPPHLHSYHKPEKHLQSGAGRGSIPCFHLLSFSNIFFTVLSL